MSPQTFKAKVTRNLQRFRHIAKDNGGMLKAALKIRKLMRKKGCSLAEIHDYELDCRSQEYAETFLTGKEEKKYLSLLNPRLYSRLARNKYLAHLLLDAHGIKAKSQLYCYYNPEMGCNSPKTAFDISGVLSLLKSQNIKECVIKTTEGSHGDNVWVIKDIHFQEHDALLRRFDGEELCLSSILNQDPLVFESLIAQNQQFAAFNPSSVNTIRFMTVLLPGGEAKVIAVFGKVGRAGHCVDNAGHGGNVDYTVDLETGVIKHTCLFNAFRDTTPIEKHPDTNVAIEGVKIENWKQIKRKVEDFQRLVPFVKAVGWDIAITDDGPAIIEMNDMWDCTGQIFIGRGWHPEIKACYEAWQEYYKNYPRK